MSKKNTIAWLQAHAEAHRQRWRDYEARAIGYKSANGHFDADQRDIAQSMDLASQHFYMAIGIEEAISALQDRRSPTDLGPLAPPIPGSLAEVLAGKGASS